MNGTIQFPIARCVVMIGVVLITAVAMADPMGPRARIVPDEIRGLADLKRVRIDVVPPTSPLSDLGFNAERFETALTKHLTRTGIEVADDPELPKIVLVAVGKQDEHLPEALAWNLIVAVHQKVMLHRVGQEMRVPTASISQLMLVKKKAALRSIESAMKTTVNGLTTFIRQANRTRPRKKD